MLVILGRLCGRRKGSSARVQRTKANRRKSEGGKFHLRHNRPTVGKPAFKGEILPTGSWVLSRMGEGVGHDVLGSFRLSENTLSPPGVSLPGRLTSEVLKSLFFIPTSNPIKRLVPFLSMATDSLSGILSKYHL